MSSGLDYWERFGVITGGDEVCILPPPTFNRVAEKMRTYFEMGTDGQRFFPFQSGISFLRRYLRAVSVHNNWLRYYYYNFVIFF